jgi:hypothetical protein
MKTLLRWTIGPVHECGFDVLLASVRKMRSLYDFDYVVCYNGLSDEQIGKLKDLEVDLIDQGKYVDSIKIPPSDGYFVGWKLYPPRLNLHGHEIFIDNDVVLHLRLPAINRFLRVDPDCVLLYQGLHGLHGAFSKDIPHPVRINSGLFGVPPNFRFGDELCSRVGQWKDYFDEQGLVGACLLSHPRHTFVSLHDLPIIEPTFDLGVHDGNLNCCGFHFVGANKQHHPKFYEYMNRNIL